MKREPIASVAMPTLQHGPDVLNEIVRQLAGLRFGSVEIVIHDGVVTQIERREKVRLSCPTAPRRD